MKTDLITTSLVPTLNTRYVGYDNLFDELFALMSYDPNAGLTARLNNDKFPPYNIEKVHENEYAISVAVAGFKRDDLIVEVDNSMLVITGNKTAKNNENMIYQGIAERSFKRTFRLGEYVEVNGVRLEDGILTVNLVKNIPESMKPRRITID